MDLPRDVNDYMKQSIDDSLGIPVSSQTLEAKLRASQESQWRLREQLHSLFPKLKQKDQLIERLKCEATMNARAVKKFVEENQRLAMECGNLLGQCHHLEKECALYDQDREALMEFGNDADERARLAQSRVLDLERDLLLMKNELKTYKHQHELINSSLACTLGEKNLLDSFLATVTSKDDDSTYAFLEVNSENESCKKLLSMWNCIRPSTRRVLSLVAKVKSLEKNKEHLRTNLHKAEEEVKLLFDENNILDEENKRLFRQYKERNHPDSGGKYTNCSSAKSNKRKSSPRTSSSMERKLDFDDLDSERQPLSPLRNNSRDCRMHKK
ncbi:uncharacterized protein LOC113865978 [Abrus precatorius]|uniref:Uncharacterized protein LOC113865978 n=1 Tax=Abrus precatorius TaxID=3816 RepID=A0A8B8LK37_ABRPR|nr:uncharacterized protein LOC113865978 [Abrus precatorius]